MNQSRIITQPSTIGKLSVTSGSRTATNLNSAFVNGTGGAAVAIRFMAQTADPIDELYVFLDSVATTVGATTVAAKIYNENTASKPGTTTRATSTATTMPAAVDQWVKIVFGTPYTPAIGEILWIVVYNTSGAPGTDYPGIMSATNALIGTALSGTGYATGYTTTDGFTTNGATAGELPFVLKCGSNLFGQPFTQFASTYHTSNTRQRGIVVTPTEDISFNGATFNAASSTFNEIKVYDNATIPGGTALATYDLDSNANATTGDICGATTFAPYTLTGGDTYKIVLTFGSSAQAPSVLQIEDYSSYSSVFDSLRAQDTLNMPWSAIDDGAGGWTIDKAICPALALYIDDNPAQAGGGGLLVHPGMGGGARG